MPLLIPSSKLETKLRSANARGLTLIELLIAMAIFAIMATSMFIAFDNVQKAKEVTDRASARLKQYQSAFNRISQDFQQIYPRSIRDEFGDPKYSLDYQTGTELQFTRTGWTRSSFFTQQQRSELQRVSYYLEDGKLMRGYWRTLDQAQGDQPVRTVLLDGVSDVSYKFFYNDHTKPTPPNPIDGVHEQWPPDSLRNLQPTSGEVVGIYPPIQYLILPGAIDITLTTDDLGTITRSFLIASGSEFVFK